MRMLHHLNLILVPCAILALASGCTDDEPNTTPTPTPSNNSTTKEDMASNSGNQAPNSSANSSEGDMGEPDMAGENQAPNSALEDMGSGNNQSGNNATTCEGDECDWSMFGECERVNDLGQLSPGAQTIVGSTAGLQSGISTSCAMDGEMAVEYVWAFTPEVASFITIETRDEGGLDWVVSTRGGECAPAAERICRDSGVIDYLVSAGEQQFIVAEPIAGMDTGRLELDLTIEAAVCDMLGARTCDGDSIKVCEGGTEEVLYACGTTCEMDECVGNTCDRAEVLGQPGAYEYTGSLEAYTSDFDSADIDSCAQIVGQTPGAEMVFSLPGLTAGQTVTIEANDAADQNDNAILILDGCGQTAECVAGDELLDALTWTVTADGDYTVIVDNISRTSKDFKHVITIQ